MSIASRSAVVSTLLMLAGSYSWAQHGSGSGGHSGGGMHSGGGSTHAAGVGGRSAPSSQAGTSFGAVYGSRLGSAPPGFPASAYSIGIPASAYSGARGGYPAYSNSFGGNGQAVYGPWRAGSAYGRGRRLPYGYFAAPYYPLWGFGDDYGYGDYGYGYDDPGYGGGSPSPYPPADYQPGPSSDTAGLGDQIQQLSAQVNDLQNQLGRGGLSGPAETDVQSTPPRPSPPLTVVLNSGQTLQIQNYAVMGNTLWDLSSQPMKKIPIARINIEASSKASEANGADFPELGNLKR